MAVLPIVRVRWLDPTCLVIGSMAPDFEYFIHGQLEGRFGHTWPGLVGWCLPVTLVLAALWHFVVKRPLALVAPDAIARRLPVERRWPPSIVACGISALVGGATHLVWDGMTHAQGWAQRWFPHTFNHLYTVPVLGPIPLFRVCQHVSTAIGLAVVAYFIVRALRRGKLRAIELRDGQASSAGTAQAGALDRRGPRAIFIGCTLAAIAALFGRAWFVLESRDPGTLVVAPISGLLAGTLVAAVIVRLAYPERVC